MKRIVTLDQEADIRRLHADGLGCAEIGRRLQLSTGLVDRARRRLGLPAIGKIGAPLGNRNAAGPQRRVHY
jgi:hypothetical protein